MNSLYSQPELGQAATFVGKVAAVKTRSGKAKDYFSFRTYVPKDAAEKLKLANGDYLFFRAEKAKWYHMVEWKEMQKTWNRLPVELKTEIVSSGMDAPIESGWTNTVVSPTGASTYTVAAPSQWVTSMAASVVMGRTT